jgi:uncharacterized protein
MFEDIYVVDTNDPKSFLIYAPGHKAIFAVNEAGAKAFEALKSDPTDLSNPMYQIMVDKGLNSPPPPIQGRRPHADITVCPTFRCKLRCIYCFAFGGDRSDGLDYQSGCNAIEYALTSRKLDANIATSRLTLHGGGEPTDAWPLISDLVKFHQSKCKELGIDPTLSIVSNGLWSPTIYDWVIKNADRISISCDGMPEIQDLHRPLASGDGSSGIVYKTLQKLGASGVNFGIRSTITEHNVKRMKEMVQFFYELARPKSLQFERLSVCGRAEDSLVLPGISKDFIDSFGEAHELAMSLGITLSCSGIRIFRRSNLYCGAAGNALCVTPDGLFTTCHRVDGLNDPLGPYFIFGASKNGVVSVNNDQITALRKNLSVENNPHCQDCFCKNTCAGGCYAARFTESGSLIGQPGAERCTITKALTRHQLIQMATKKAYWLRLKENQDG